MPKKTLTCAVACGAHVMVQVKGNQPDLLAACVSLMDRCAATQEHVQVDKGHGRIETRIVQTYTPVSGWLPDGWSEVRQIVRVSRAVERKESSGIWKTSHETACWISTIALSAAICQAGIRGHWCVENQNHHVRDVTLREDYCRVRQKPAILARLRSVCLNCMRSCDVVNMAVAVFRNALNFDALVAMARKT